MQPAVDYTNIQRRPLDVGDYLEILRRRWQWIAGGFLAGLVISVIVAFVWPDTYVAKATMRIAPAVVPERIVPTNFNMQMAERLLPISQLVTRTENLKSLIKKHNLYRREQERRPLDDICEEMRKDIEIQMQGFQQQAGGRPGSAFRISYAYSTREGAVEVVKDLVAEFNKQNTSDRRNQTKTTTRLLEEEWRSAKAELDRIETDLTNFRMRNRGNLPEELQNVMNTINTMQLQLAGANEAINRAAQDRFMLQTSLENAQNQMKALSSMQDEASSAIRGERLSTVNKTILEMETQLSAFREVYKEEHPDIRSLKAKLDVVKRERDRLQGQEKNEDSAVQQKVALSLSTQRQQRDLDANIRSIQTQIKVKELEVEQRTKDQGRLRSQIETLQNKLSTSPIGQNEYTKLSRDYQLAKTRYDDLTLKRSQSETATKVEDNQAGENLEELDPPSVPLKPSEPNRWMIVATGISMGLLVGLFLAGGQEAKDRSLKNLKDIRAYTKLNILTSVPLLENDLALRNRRRLAFVAWSSAVLVGIALMSGSVLYHYYYKF